MIAGSTSISSVIAHPERITKYNVAGELIGRSTSKCATQIAARKAAIKEKRAASLYQRRTEEASRLGRHNAMKGAKRDVYSTIQNETCVLALETVFGPYAVDEEIFRRDVREDQTGVELYLDIGVLDVEMCQPLLSAYFTIWHCNAEVIYSGFTGIDPDKAELADGQTKQADGTTGD